MVNKFRVRFAFSSLRFQFASLSVRNRRLLSVGLRPGCSANAMEVLR